MGRPRLVGLMWAVAACLLVAALLAAARTKPNSFTRDLNSSGLAWLGSHSSGLVSQVSGSAGDVVASVQLFSGGRPFDTYQLGSNGLAVLRDTGDAKFVSGSTLQASDQLPFGEGKPVRVVPAGSQVFVVGGGSLKVFDPNARAFRGKFSLDGSGVDDAVVDGRGVLWLLDAVGGSLRSFAKGNLGAPKKVGGAASGSRLVFDGDQVGVFTPNPPAIERVTGGGTVCAKELQGMTDVDPGSVDVKGSSLAVLSRTTHRLVRVDLNGGSCRSVDLGARDGGLGTPASVGTSTFVPTDSGSILRVDWSSQTPAPQAISVPKANTIELLARNGFVYWNDPNTANAGVLYPAQHDIQKVGVGEGSAPLPAPPSVGGEAAPGQPSPKPLPGPASPNVHTPGFALLQTEVKAGVKTPVVRDLSSPRPDKISWDWGDGTKSGGTPGDQASHTYDQSGQFSVTVTATWGNEPPITSQPKSLTVVPKDAIRDGDFVVDVAPPPTIVLGGQFTVNAHSTVGPAVDITSSEPVCSASKVTSDSTRSSAQITARAVGTCSVEFRQPAANGINPHNPVKVPTEVLSSAGVAPPSGQNRPSLPGTASTTSASTTSSSTTSSSTTSSSTTSTTKPSFTVPNLVGMQIDKAIAQVASCCQGVTVAQQARSSTQAAGVVLDSDPKPAQPIAAGQTLTAFVSGGVALPCPLANTTRAAAEAALQALGLTANVTLKHDKVVPQGTVISSQPACPGFVPPSSAVGLTVSQGPLLVPDVTNMAVDVATTTLSKAGLVVKEGAAEASATTAKGNVIRTVPAAATPVDDGSTVTIVPSKGPAPAVDFSCSTGTIVSNPCTITVQPSGVQSYIWTVSLSGTTVAGPANLGTKTTASITVLSSTTYDVRLQAQLTDGTMIEKLHSLAFLGCN